VGLRLVNGPHPIFSIFRPLFPLSDLALSYITIHTQVDIFSSLILFCCIGRFRLIRSFRGHMFGFLTSWVLRGEVVSLTPNPDVEDQASVFITPGDRVTQLYPRALGPHFGRLLRHLWVKVGLFSFPGHHMGISIIISLLKLHRNFSPNLAKITSLYENQSLLKSHNLTVYSWGIRDTNKRLLRVRISC
jgi:hypothetical protein